MTGGPTLSVGQAVTTTDFGPGTVIRVTKTGVIVRLTTLQDLEVEFTEHEVVADGPDQSASDKGMRPIEAVVATSVSPVRDTDLKVTGDYRARRSIEALRFGLVPKQGIDTLTLGYPELEAWANQRFPNVGDERPKFSAVIGPFGTGKSHSMAVVRHVADREGFVHARVEVDGQRVSLSMPQELLYQLWSTTAAGGFDSSTPILDLYVAAIDRRSLPPIVAPRGLDRVNENYQAVESLHRTGRLDTVGEWVDGVLSSSTAFTHTQANHWISLETKAWALAYRLRPMIGKTSYNKPYDFIESLIGHAMVSRLAGFRGLVVTIDEFEVERNLSGAKYAVVRELLNVLSRYASGDLDYSPSPLAVFFATVGDDDHDGDDIIRRLVGTGESGYFELPIWTAEDRQMLASRIFDLYCSAYGIERSFESRLVQQLERNLERLGYDNDSGLIRAFIKRYVSALDALYGPPYA